VTGQTQHSTDTFPYDPHFRHIDGVRIHYVSQGDGAPIVHIHGNPTWSYLWRNILPYSARHGRALAFDLVGMGRSDKPDIAYTFDEHYRYVRGFLDQVGDRMSLVLHDWGGPLGLTYALDHPDRIRTIVLMETLITPFTWGELPATYRLGFGLMRWRPSGFLLNRLGNVFVNGVLPNAVAPGVRLSAMAKRYYREPYPTVASRKPPAQWPREIPFSREHRNYPRLARIRDELRGLDKPLMLLHARPGAIMPPERLTDLRALLPSNHEVVDVGRGLHYIQEAVPERIGAAIDGFLEHHHHD